MSRLILVCIVAMFLGVPVMAEGQTPIKLQGLDRHVARLMELSHVPGVAISVVQGDEIILAKGYGVRKEGTSQLVNADTIFAIGSMTKNMTATALGLLVEDGVIDWDEPITRYVPGLRFSDPYLNSNISLRDALAHRTGLERADLLWFAHPGASRQEMLSLIEGLPGQAPFRASYLYNNFPFLAAGEIIPATVKKSWDQFLKERLFQPLNMSRTNTDIRELEHVDNVAYPHFLMPEKAISTDYYDLSHMGPAGSVNSSANDMAKWCQMQLGAGTFKGQEIVSSKIIKEIRKPYNFMELEQDGHIGNIHQTYTFGLIRMNYGAEHVAYSHGGSIQGMASTIVFIPQKQTCVVVLTNGETGSGVREYVSNWIMDHLLNIEFPNYIEAFNKYVQPRRGMKLGAAHLHRQTHDPSIAATVTPESLVGDYHNPTYGSLTIKEVNGVMRAFYGTIFNSALKPHRGNAFDLVSDDPKRAAATPAPLSLSAAQDKSGRVQSLLLQMPGPLLSGIRFEPVIKGGSKNRR